MEFSNKSIGAKVSAALAAGCSIILKAPEETPSSCAELIRAFGDAGIPPGAVNLVFGVPSEISEYLVPHPVIKKITFTGSTSVGKQLASLAGLHMKRVTMMLAVTRRRLFLRMRILTLPVAFSPQQVPKCGPSMCLSDEDVARKAFSRNSRPNFRQQPTR